MQKKVQELLSKMTVEEKASFCSGKDFWHLEGNERLGIPSIMVSDGPHGLRKQPESADHLGIHDSIPATCFPTASCLASSWDRGLVHDVGVALGEETQAEGVSILLGPGANIKRSPLCGRNFEYYSEDPYVTGEMAKSFINGVQSKGVGTSLKHFAVNNQETRRITVDVDIDERTLREIYLPGFETAVKEAKPWTVMCSYNKVNGVYAANHPYLLTDILRDEWGFEGFVVSDWGAVNDIVASVMTGLELEMPSTSGIGEGKILEAIKDGRLSEEKLDEAVGRILRIILKADKNNKIHASYDQEKHHQLARKAASESMVLLKNDENLLPLDKGHKIAVIGEFAKNPRIQGGGSSHINPTKTEIGYEEIVKLVGAENNVSYAAGYSLNNEDESYIHEAIEHAKEADVAVLFVGLPDIFESEGYDRTHLYLPESHQKLIEAVAEVNENVVVVLSNGAPVEMPWIDQVKAVLEGYLGGQASGGAVADLLFGIVNPSGKLAETFPLRLEDNPSYLNFPGERDKVAYQEGIYVGYRYYDSKKMPTLFPFGHGLSYTQFEYSNLLISDKAIKDADLVTVQVTIKNVGDTAGHEIVQLYVKDIESVMNRPEKELKGFEKVYLESNEEKTLTFQLNSRAFAYYDVDLEDWYVETGDFDILVGSSSATILLKDTIHVKSTIAKKLEVTRNTTIGDVVNDPILRPIFFESVQTLNLSKLEDDEQQDSTAKIMKELVKNADLRSIVVHGKGRFTEEHLQLLIDKLNAAEN